MWMKNTSKVLMAGTLVLTPMGMGGCESLPGSAKEQGAVGGGAGGAAAGAAVAGEGNRLVGALIGGVVGAGGGYLIGSQTGKIGSGDQGKQEAKQAVQKAQNDPATVSEVRDADTADLNEDGFVTADEIVAMEQAGLSDEQMLKRLRATDQVFELNQSQQQYLSGKGISDDVIERMQHINEKERDRVLQPHQNKSTGQDVLGHDRQQ